MSRDTESSPGEPVVEGRDAGGTVLWEHFPHVADIGVRGFGGDLAAAFANGALALTAVICDPATVRPGVEVAVDCRAANREFLFVEWLNALVFEMATRGMLFGRFDIAFANDTELRATIWGEPVDVARHQPAVEVKGATLTELKVEPTTDGRWLAQCVVDV